jgi:hypothetical protein
MTERFQVAPEHWAVTLRRWTLVVACFWVLGLASEAIHLHPNLRWEWPSAWAPVLTKAGRFFVVFSLARLPNLWSRLVGVEMEPTGVVVHRAIEEIPLIGPWCGPRRFPRADWRLASTDRGLFIGKPSSDPSFQWEEVCIFDCPEAVKPALKAWIARMK